MFQGDAFVLAAVMLSLLSPFVGSFAAVLADRLPRGEDVVTARSRCRSCTQVLTARDLIPLLSFGISGGRCRHCGARIPRWLWIMEAGALLLTLGLVAGWAPYGFLPGVAAMMTVEAMVLWTLLALVAADLLWMRLPNLLTAVLFGLALMRALIWAQNPHAETLLLAPSPQSAGLGALVGAGSFALLRFGYQKLRGREGLGLGDVKLMAGLGALVGPLMLPQLVLVAALGMLGWAVMRGETRRASAALPFGAALAAAGILVMAWRLIGGGL